MGDVRVFDLLRGPHWTLLVFDDPSAEVPAETSDLRVRHIVRPGVDGGLVDVDGTPTRRTTSPSRPAS